MEHKKTVAVKMRITHLQKRTWLKTRAAWIPYQVLILTTTHKLSLMTSSSDFRSSRWRFVSYTGVFNGDCGLLRDLSVTNNRIFKNFKK